MLRKGVSFVKGGVSFAMNKEYPSDNNKLGKKYIAENYEKNVRNV